MASYVCQEGFTRSSHGGWGIDVHVDPSSIIREWNEVPHDVRLWETVEKQNRGSASSIPNEDLRFINTFSMCYVLRL